MIEDNKLIDLFMAEFEEFESDRLTIISDLNRGATPNEYNEYWDLLIPVAKKCLDTPEATEGQHYFINEALLTLDISIVFDRVVEFIKDLNESN